jgi:hypothetical protein
MNYLIINLLALFSISMTACNKDKDPIVNEALSNDKLKITVGSSVFTATLYDNASAKAFKDMLPLTINMIELNNNEKYYDLPQNLPTNTYKPNAIKNGDLMLYGSRTLVLFYKNFSSSYSYTRLGKVDNTTGLASALGSGNVTVTFEVE